MKTASERLDALEETVAKLHKERLGMAVAVFTIIDAALRALRDNRVIQGVHYRIAEEMMRQAASEALAAYPELLDEVRFRCFPSPWKRHDA